MNAADIATRAPLRRITVLPRLLGIWRHYSPGLTLLAVIVAAWILAVVVGGYDQLIIPSPVDVAAVVAEDPTPYLGAAADSLLTMSVGLVLGLVFGVGCALLAWWNPLTAGMAGPASEALRAIPTVVLIPIMSRALGYGEFTTMVIVATGACFPAYVLVIAALRDYPPSSYEYFASIGATKRQAMIRLAVPSAMPSFVLAVQLGAILAVIGAVSTEYITGSGGLGTMLAQSKNVVDGTAQRWAVAVLTTVIAYAAYLATRRLHRAVIARFS